MTAKERALLYILAAAQFANIMDFMIMMPLGPQLMRIFSISAQQFSWLVASYTLSAGISGFLVVFVADNHDRKKLLLLMFSGFILGTLACALSKNFSFLLFARVITGIFGGVIGSIVMAIVSDTVPMKRRGEAMGLVTTAFSMASVFGVPFGLFLANQISWHAPFLFLVIFSIPLLWMMHKKIPNVREHLKHDRVHPIKTVHNIISNANQMKALVFICFMMFSHFVIIPFLSPSMVANVGFKESELTWIYFIGGAVTIVSGPWVGKLADRIGKQNVFLSGVIFSFFPIYWITHMGHSSVPLALIATTLFFVSGGWRIIPAMAIVSGTVLPKNRGSFMSFQSSMQQIALAAASFLAGLIVLKDSSGHLLRYEIVGYISIVMGILSMIMVHKIEIIDHHVKGAFSE